MLSVKKVRAGGAVDYYIGQVRSGIADYYLAETGRMTPDRRETLYAPGSSWWGGGADDLGVAGAVNDRQFVALFDRAEHPDGSGRHVGSRFRQPAAAGALADAAAAAADGVDDPYRRWMAKHEARRKGPQASVAAWDCTFSPVKSVSILWAGGDLDVQEEVWAAHETAVDAGLDYLQEHAAFVRAGRNGVRVLDTSGLVVARFNEWTSRSGDMQIHTHSLLLNRAKTRTDGKWRALDGRAVLAAKAGAGALYNRTLEAELTRRVGVDWRDRPDGLREIDGIDDDLIETFSTRRRAITERVDRLVEAYEAKYGVAPSPTVQWRMAQDATLATRPAKTDLPADEALDKWEATAIAQGRRLAGVADAVVGRNRRHGRATTVAPEQLLSRLADIPRATFSRHDLLRAALDVIDPDDHDPDGLRRQAEQLVQATIANAQLLQVSAPDVDDVSDGLRRSDGSSVYERPGRGRWALTHTIDAEAWLLQAAAEPGAPTVAGDVLEAAADAHGLGGDQRQAVVELFGDDRRVSQLVGPAGAGKTRALRAAVEAWQTRGGEVIGLTVSQAAANVLATEANVRAANTSKWLHETGSGRWSMPHGALVLVDEASMVATDQLVAIVDQTRRTNSKVVLVGDPAQLAAVHVGGAFDLLIDRHGAVRLTEVRRFTAEWEATASLQLRARDPACLAAYAMRGRIHSGTSAQVEADLFAAWQADATSTGEDPRRRSVLMVVTTNEQANILNDRARTALLDAGVVDGSGPTVTLRDNLASVGDHLVTRRNRRTLATSNGGWVVNGDVWTILAVHRNGSVDLRRHGDAATVTLPGDYLADHAHLGYATTAHRAQGMTVDACHALATAGDTHEQLYVVATRGRHANHIWVAVDTQRDQIRDDHDLPTAERILSSILNRRDPDRLAAHQTIADSQHGITSLGRLGAIYEDACRRATRQWAADTLARHGIEATGDPQWPALVAKLRQLALSGHDQQHLLTHVAQAPLGDGHSAAGVLHWRLDDATATAAPVHPRGLSGAIPPGDSEDTVLARQAVEQMGHRWRQLRHQLTHGPTPTWVGPLGPRPAGPDTLRARRGQGERAVGLDSWLTAATAAAAYRERYDLADHTNLTGPRPAASRPDARAAHDHAQHHIDRHLAVALHLLADDQLDRLEHDQQQILDSMPTFDPQRLDQTHRTRDSLQRQQRAATNPVDKAHLQSPLDDAQRDVARLEHLAREHREWRRTAAGATDTLRQIRLVKQLRASRTPVSAARRR